MPWWQRGLGAGSSLTSFFTALLLYIDDSVISATLICITACAWCFSIFYCFPAQCFSITVHYIAMTCRCAFSTSTLSNSEGFQCVDLSCLYSWQFDLLTELTRCLHSHTTGELATCRRELMIKSSMCRKGIICEYVDVLNCQWGLKSFNLRYLFFVLHCWILWLQSRLM